MTQTNISPNTPPVKRLALIGNYLPRQCGIATFTADLHAALMDCNPDLHIHTLAMTDPGRSYDYPPEVDYEIAQESADDYLIAADHINSLDPDAISIQHEFGIFGGAAGEFILKLTERVRAPIIVTLHTVLTEPNPDQRRVMNQLAEHAARLVVMTEMGRTILTRDWNMSPDKIEVIPHGIPDLPFLSSAFHKQGFGLEDRKTVLTFGLLSPNKGIENMIDALPPLVKDIPDLTYVVLGATHPNLVAYEGEAYRERLMEQARALGVADNLHFVNQYADTPTLQAWLSAADVYVTPYLNEAQITSGTLSYAVGMGKAVVSTPYWHAKELLADGVGALVPFADPQALSETIRDLLLDSDKRNQMRTRAYEIGRQMIWPAVGNTYLKLFSAARSGRTPLSRRKRRPGQLPHPAPTLAAIERMVDGVGILQHGISSVANRRTGYCLDDNARALMLAVDLKEEGIEVANASRIIDITASFVDYAWDLDNAVFRNFMDYQRHWMEKQGSEDSHGRALWALGRVLRHSRDDGLKQWISYLGEHVIPASDHLVSPRARAFAVLGLLDWIKIHPGHRTCRRLIREYSDALLELHKEYRREDWDWFEPVLAYDNARLPEVMLKAGQYFDDAQLLQTAHDTMNWLVEVQTSTDGIFRPVGTASFGRHYEKPLPFDQQPLEAWATVEACQQFYEHDQDSRWKTHAEAAFDWYLGRNDLGLRIATDDGGCFDGLHADRVNLNRGAESLLAFQYAGHAIRKVRKLARAVAEQDAA